MAGLNGERVVAAAQGVGMAERTLRTCSPTSRSESSSASRSGRFQNLSHRIADLAIELECSRLITYDVAARVDAGRDTEAPAVTSMAKVKVTETAKQIALEGMQMMGGYGYACEYDMERHVRRAGADDLRRHQRDSARDHLPVAGSLKPSRSWVSLRSRSTSKRGRRTRS